MRRGYRTAVYNSRGVHWLDPEAKEERALAEKYRKQAEEVENHGYFRFANILKELSDSYIREAERRNIEDDS